jgi:hypothetical protein
MALVFGTSTALTITAASIVSAGNRSSAAVTVGTTNNTTQIWLTVNVLTSSSAPTGNKQIVVYGYKSEDGTNYGGLSGTDDNVDGTDKALTAIGSPTNLTLLGTIQLNQGAVAVTARGVFEVTQSPQLTPKSATPKPCGSPARVSGQSSRRRSFRSTGIIRSARRSSPTCRSGRGRRGQETV